MNEILLGIANWIKEDWISNRFRFIIEIAAWAISIGCSLVVALTVPEPPFHYLYPTWILGCSMYAWAAYTRRSFGMLANYILLVSVDMLGLIRLILN